VLTYGLQPGALYRARQIQVDGRGSFYTLVQHEQELGPVYILAGRHYVCNSWLPLLSVAPVWTSRRSGPPGPDR
jgi:UDP-N-acetylmuramate-alanine ligase